MHNRTFLVSSAILAIGLIRGRIERQPALTWRAEGMRAPAESTVTISVGTRIAAKLAQSLDFGSVRVGSNVYVRTATSIVANRQLAIPAGSLHNDITHWVVWNIPGSTTSIPEGGPVPSGANQVSMRGPQYMGPAPPPGHPFHHYIFEIYALNAPLDVAAGGSRADVEKAMEGKIIARGAYVGRAKPAQ